MPCVHLIIISATIRSHNLQFVHALGRFKMAEKEKMERKKCLPAWQKAWLLYNRSTLVRRMNTGRLVDLLVAKGSMSSHLDAYQKIDVLPEGLRNKRARLLLDFVGEGSPEDFWNFQAALEDSEAGCGDLAAKLSDEQTLAAKFSSLRLFGNRPSSVVKFCSDLRERYEDLTMRSLDAKASGEAMSLEKMRVNMCLLSWKKLKAMCGGDPGSLVSAERKAPLPVGMIPGMEIELKDMFEPNENGRLNGRQFALGCAGAGKTAAFYLKAAFEWGANPESFWERIALFLRYSLNDRALWKAQTVKELFRLPLSHGLRKEDEDEVLEFICQHSEEVLVVFDSLDEAKVEEEEEEDSLVWRILRGKCDDLPKLNLIISSRPCEKASALAQSSIFHRRLEVVGFTEEKIDEYVGAYFQQAPATASSLQSALRSRPEVRSLMHTPLLATMICGAFDVDGDLPDTYTEVYESSVLSMLRQSGEETGRRGPRSILGDLPSDRLQSAVENLSKVAFDGLVKKQAVFKESELEAAKCLSGSVEVGFLSSAPGVAASGDGEDSFAFRHHTMMEFFAAVYAVRELLGRQKQSMSKMLETVGMDEDKTRFWQFVSGLTEGSDCEAFLAALSAKYRKVKQGKRFWWEVCPVLLLLLGCHDECAKRLPQEGSPSVAMVMKEFGFSITGIYLGSEEVRPMASAFRLYGEQMTKVDTHGINTDSMGTAAFVAALQHCTRLQAAQLMSLKSTSAVVDIIDRNKSSLESLAVAADDDVLPMVGPAIQKCSQITDLGIGDKAMTNVSAPVVADMLHNLQRLKMFILKGGMDDDGFPCVARELHRLPELTGLQLVSTRLSPGMLSTTLSSLEKLARLRIHSTAVGNEGVMVLASAFHRLSSLRDVTLIDVGLTWECLAVLEQRLRDTPHLKQCSMYCEKRSFLPGSKDLEEVLQHTSMKVMHRYVFPHPVYVFDVHLIEGIVLITSPSPTFVVYFYKTEAGI